MKLIIATPFYELKGFSPYISSLIQSVQVLNAAKIQFEFWDHNGDSYVDRARNTICARFLESDGTHLLFIDSDMSWDPAGFARLLASPHDVTGCAYPVKNNWEEYGVRIICDGAGRPTLDDGGRLLAEFVPAGMLLLSRGAVQAMSDAYRDSGYLDPSADPTAPQRWYPALFECITKNGLRHGEDVTFCHRWRDIGGRVWLEPRITFGHWGNKGFLGNYHTFLRRQPGGDLHGASPARGENRHVGSGSGGG